MSLEENKGGRINQNSSVQQDMVIWKAPEEGWMKINCDKGFKKENGIVGIGVVVRNDSGSLVDGVYGMVKVESALIAEALAVREGTKMAIIKGYQKVELEMCSLIIYNEITKERRTK